MFWGNRAWVKILSAKPCQGESLFKKKKKKNSKKQLKKIQLKWLLFQETKQIHIIESMA